MRPGGPRPRSPRPRSWGALLATGLLVLVPTLAGVAANLSWETRPGHRRAAASPATAAPSPGERRVGFTSLGPSSTGVLFTNRLADERSLTNQIYLNGSGVAAGDVDGDGLCDLYFCGLDGDNALYRNLGGWRFEDTTARAGVACAGLASTGAALVDLDGDGALDLLVNAIGAGTRLFLGDGKGRFRDATVGSGLEARTGSASFAIGDVDGDGRLDVYVVNYRSDTMRDMPGIAFTVGVTNGVRRLLTVDGRPADGPEWAGRFTFGPANGILENGEPDALFRNLGGGRFERVPWGSAAFVDERGQPVPAPFDWGLSAMFRDLDGDRAPDLYVCNDFQSPDRIWLNDGRGTFRAAPASMFRQTSLFSMGVDFADIDRDGHDDVFVADMLSREHARRQVQVMNTTAARQSRQSNEARPQYSRNTLFRNRGAGSFAEIAQLA
ncbi:MAG: VCBS repeat-containing protein, partial [Verrucomicrobiales bacterium]|nr:VCBS repeat-containing protein [Verrucomicrobiales bacterium]